MYFTNDFLGKICSRRIFQRSHSAKSLRLGKPTREVQQKSTKRGLLSAEFLGLDKSPLHWRTAMHTCTRRSYK